MVLASAGLRATGKLRPTTLPVSINSSNGGNTRPVGSEGQGLPSYSSFGGQNTRRTFASVSKRDKKTTIPCTIEVLTSERKNFQCSQYQYWTLSNWSRCSAWDGLRVYTANSADVCCTSNCSRVSVHA